MSAEPSAAALLADVRSIWLSLFPDADLDDEQDFFQLGGTSLQLLELGEQISSKLRMTFDFATLTRHPTPRAIVDAAQKTWRTPAKDSTALPEIQPRRRGDGHPLSMYQEQLWYTGIYLANGELIQPISRGFYRITGQLDVDLLKSCLDFLVDRHAILRTDYPKVDGRVTPRVRRRLDVPVEFFDIRGASPKAQTDFRNSLLKTPCFEPINLQRGPLFRVRLIRTGTSEYTLGLVFHHFISDAYSVGLVVTRLFELYADLHAGRTPALRPPAVQYADYAAWERSLTGPQLESSIAYWEQRRQLLGGDPDGGATAASMPKTADAVVCFRIADELLEELARFSQRHRFLLSQVVFSAFAAACARRLPDPQVSIGIMMSGRVQPGLAQMLGPLMKQMFVVLSVPRALSFMELCLATAREVEDLHRYPVLPPDWSPRVLLDRVPIVFNWVTEIRPIEAATVSVNAMTIADMRTHIPFSTHLFARHIGAAIELRLDYVSSVIDEEAATAIAADTMALLQFGLENPSLPLRDPARPV